MMNEKKREARSQRDVRLVSAYLVSLLLILAWAFMQPRTAQAQWTTQNASGNINSTNTGNVGVGTDAPVAKFQIAFDGSAYNNANSAAFSFGPASTLGKKVYAGYDTSIDAGFFQSIYFGTAYKNLVLNPAGGNVGIGTTTPRLRFEAKGVASMPATSGTTQTGSMRLSQASGSLVIDFGLGGNPGYGWLQVVDSSDLSSNYGLLLNPNGGVVGIGTSAPNTLYKLDVSGKINATQGLCIDGTCKNSWSEIGGGGTSQWTTSGSNIYYNTGSVFIGTTSGAGKFRARLSADNNIIFNNAGSNDNRIVAINDADSAAVQLSIQADPLLFRGTGGVEVGRITGAGTFGIGTATPNSSYKLDVAGSINASGNINATGDITATGRIEAKYQDVAEWVPSRQKLSAGTVVILDPEKSNQVIASIEAYDTRVAGVISEQPGVLLGEGGEGKVKVATTGRVKVKVDASRGPIKIGDLLVTSGEEGVAMKSEAINFQGRMIHAPGTIIGKALEPWEKGKGEILVLLSLQ